MAKRREQRNPQHVGQKEIGVFIQDQDSPPFQYYLMKEEKTDITLTKPASKGVDIINVSAGHGFTTDKWISIFENGKYLQTQVKNVSVNAITLYNSLSTYFTVNATIIRGTIEMNIDVSGGDEEFIFHMRQSTIPIDVQHVHMTIWNEAAAGDDGMFGDQTVLTNGIRVLKTNDRIDQGLGNYRSNSDFREFGAEVNYTAKAPGGTNAVDISFDVKEVYGIVIRVSPNHNIFKAIVRDKLDALKRYRISIMGQYTVGEN